MVIVVIVATFPMQLTQRQPTNTLNFIKHVEAIFAGPKETASNLYYDVRSGAGSYAPGAGALQ